MSDTDLPITKYIVRHRQGSERHLRHCVHFITFGLLYGPTKIRFPTILTLDLSNHLPPPQHLCERFTGLHREVAKSFFSVEANEAEFHRALGKLERRMKREPLGGCVAVRINCMAGMHRSVAMANRLAEEVSRWDGFKAQCLHLDLGKGADPRDETAERAGPR